MIKDMLKPYKEAVSKDKDVILDNYTLKDGIYILLSPNRPIEITNNNYLIINRKSKENEMDEIKNPELYKLFKEMDYCSVILNDDTNKCIDLPAKKIHSTNWMTLFIKKDICPEIAKEPINKEELVELINGYYEKIKQSEDKFLEIYNNSLHKEHKIKGKEKDEFFNKYFKEQIEYIRKPERIQKIEKNKQFIIGNFDKIIENIKKFSNEFTGYIKIFIEESLDTYNLENEIYMIPRIFNVNDYNLFIDDEIYGLPANNITTNSKKPYLILKTMQCSAPFRLKTNDVRYSKNYFEWLNTQGKFKEIKLDYYHEFDGTEPHKRNNSYYSIHLNKNSEIDEYDNIPFDKPELKFTLFNVLGVMEKIENGNSSTKVMLQDEQIVDYKKLQQKFSENFFNNRMQGYFKDMEPDVKTNEFTAQMKALFILGRDALYDFFNRGIDVSVKHIVNKLTMDIIIEKLRNTVQGTNTWRLAKAYNLRVSFLKYFELGGMDVADRIKSTMDNLRRKLKLKELVICENDDEFYFVAGQLAYYLFSQSESDKKTFGLFEPILSAKNPIQLKRRLSEIFAVYKHAISIDNISFKNAMAMVMGYETTNSIKDSNQDMLLAGILANNIFYEKKEDKQ